MATPGAGDLSRDIEFLYGKLIGVISHVQTMKERISSQIQVTSLTGNRQFNPYIIN